MDSRSKCPLNPHGTPFPCILEKWRGQHPPHPSNPLSSLSMRKIETQMIAAIKNNIDWKSANTEVVSQQNGVSYVYLHGNKIAEVGDDFLKLYDGGRQSMTTKSRLNALLSEFGYTCGTKQEYVFQKQFEWFIQMFDLTEKAMRTIPFTNGMRLAG